ncbi:MAG TPA: hypothetical protein VF057_07230, partial [Thermoanaerobaculia bacterium]
MSTEAVRESHSQSYHVELPGGVETFEFRQLRDLIRTGIVEPFTQISTDGKEWRIASEVEELRRYLDLAAKNRDAAAAAAKGPTVTPKRLILYLALGGLVAGAMLFVLAPLCMIIGAFPKFVLSFAAFGAVFALGINNAAGEDDQRLVMLSSLAFAAGGLVAWGLSGGVDFTPLRFAVIAIIGTAGLTYALGLSVARAIPVVAAAAVIFPISILLIPKTFGLMNIGLLAVPLQFLIPALPFAVFGAVVGSVMSLSA